MLPLLLIALGAGAIALYIGSAHQKATAEANLAHQVTDAHLAASTQADHQAAQYGAQNQAVPQAAAKLKAVAHAKAAQTANAVAAHKVAQAAPLAKTDQERTVTSLQADLIEANRVKIDALEEIRRAADLAAVQPLVAEGLSKAAQELYASAQDRVRVIEASLRAIGVNALAIPAHPRRDVAR